MSVMSPERAVAPERSLQQRMDALGQANRIRTARAQMKRDVRAGRLDPCDVLLSVPWHSETLKLDQLLLCVPKIGRTKARKILRRHDVSPSKTLLGLSMRQRTALVGDLAAREARRAA